MRTGKPVRIRVRKGVVHVVCQRNSYVCQEEYQVRQLSVATRPGCHW